MQKVNYAYHVHHFSCSCSLSANVTKRTAEMKMTSIPKLVKSHGQQASSKSFDEIFQSSKAERGRPKADRAKRL